jgi:hypothetical protein
VEGVVFILYCTGVVFVVLSEINHPRGREKRVNRQGRMAETDGGDEGVRFLRGLVRPEVHCAGQNVEDIRWI